MMSSQINQVELTTSTSFFDSVKTQLMYKLKTYHNAFGTLIFLHLLGSILGFFNQSYSSFSNNLDIHISLITNDLAFIFTVMMIFIFGVQLTTKLAKNMMVTFVTDKVTNHIANALLIGFVSVFGAITLSLLGIFVRMISYYMFSADDILFVDSITISGTVRAIIAMFFIIYICGSLGYLVGELVQISKIFIVIVPVLLFGFEQQVAKVVAFYGETTVLSLFIFKILLSLLVVFALAFGIGKKLEVRG